MFYCESCATKAQIKKPFYKSWCACDLCGEFCEVYDHCTVYQLPQNAPCLGKSRRIRGPGRPKGPRKHYDKPKPQLTGKNGTPILRECEPKFALNVKTDSRLSCSNDAQDPKITSTILIAGPVLMETEEIGIESTSNTLRNTPQPEEKVQSEFSNISSCAVPA